MRLYRSSAASVVSVSCRTDRLDNLRVGKSRLFREFIHSRRVHGWPIVQSTSVSHGKATAYLPVIDLLRSYFELGSGDNRRITASAFEHEESAWAGFLLPTTPRQISKGKLTRQLASWEEAATSES